MRRATILTVAILSLLCGANLNAEDKFESGIEDAPADEIMAPAPPAPSPSDQSPSEEAGRPLLEDKLGTPIPDFTATAKGPGHTPTPGPAPTPAKIAN